MAVTWQASAQVIIPLNHAGGTGPGFRAQLLYFLDDLAPSLVAVAPSSWSRIAGIVPDR
ncbi:hypothetical protein [Bradyrhizobium sp. NAS96.2]|uniref:hypothetical protein n=1 Tax=Bradyrhizobium sp. NAS96.2 TaxID=1680160 RepID=UPI00143DD5CD|nr:hypothetical protein [Bradyrhizobium sp. NAS96.2]